MLTDIVHASIQRPSESAAGDVGADARPDGFADGRAEHAIAEHAISAVNPETELHELFDLINEAFDVELGETGVAFKKEGFRRFLTLDELAQKLQACRTLVLRNRNDARILGVMCYDIPSTEPKALHFGPFAVSPRAQGAGVGRALLERVYQEGRMNGCGCVEIDVVNHRSDVLSMYERMGYERFGEQPFPFPERCSRPSYFVLLRKEL